MSYAPFIKCTIPSPEFYEAYGKLNKTNEAKVTNPNPEYEGIKLEDEKANARNRKARNMLVSSLMALATLALPISSNSSNKVEQDYMPTTIEANYNVPTEDTEVTCNPKALARGGEDDNVVELKELMGLINFASTEGLSQSEKESIEMVAMARLNQVNAFDPEAKNKINTQIAEVQGLVDKMAKEYKLNPPKTEDEQRMEYARKYITDREILSNVDFSELYRYQKDLTVVKALIAGSRGRIERLNNVDVNEEVDKQIQDAQKFVDCIVARYKKRAKVAGNTDFDNSLSQKELINLLDLRSLDGLPYAEQVNILRAAISGYKPQYFSAENEEDIKRTNEELTKIVQNTQDKLDSQADAHKRLNLIR